MKIIALCLLMFLTVAIVAEDAVLPPKAPPDFDEPVQKPKPRPAPPVQKTEDSNLISIKKLYKIGEIERDKMEASTTGTIQQRFYLERYGYFPTLQCEDGSIGVLRNTNGVADNYFNFRMRVVQIVDTNTIIGKSCGREFWVTNIGTKNLADDEVLNMDNTLFRYIGTKTYLTVLGAPRTLQAIRKMNSSEFRK